MKRSNLFSLILAGLFIGTVGMTPLLALAAERDADDRWHLTGELYIWGASISGTTRLGDDVEVDFDDLLDNLDVGFLGGLEARKGRWSLIGDITYMDVSGEKSGSLTDANLVTFTADVEVKGLIVHGLGGYNLVNADAGSADLVFGVRYLDIDSKLNLSITQPVQTPGPNFADDGSVLDAVVGLKGGIGLSRSFYIPWYIDVGTGESDFTWQAIVSVAWRPRWGEIAVGYRHIDWDLESGSRLKDVSFSGPGVNFRFHFF